MFVSNRALKSLRQREKELRYTYGIYHTSWEEDWPMIVGLITDRDLTREQILNKGEIFRMFPFVLQYFIALVVSFVLGIFVFKSFWWGLFLLLGLAVGIFFEFKIIYWLKNQKVDRLNKIIGAYYEKYGRINIKSLYKSYAGKRELPPQPNRYIENDINWNEPVKTGGQEEEPKKKIATEHLSPSEIAAKAMFEKEGEENVLQEGQETGEVAEQTTEAGPETNEESSELPSETVPTEEPDPELINELRELLGCKTKPEEQETGDSAIDLRLVRTDHTVPADATGGNNPGTEAAEPEELAEPEKPAEPEEPAKPEEVEPEPEPVGEPVPAAQEHDVTEAPLLALPAPKEQPASEEQPVSKEQPIPEPKKELKGQYDEEGNYIPTYEEIFEMLRFG